MTEKFKVERTARQVIEHKLLTALEDGAMIATVESAIAKATCASASVKVPFTELNSPLNLTITEPSQTATFPAIGNADEAPKGLGSGGNKPLMRNRCGPERPPAIGNAAGNIFASARKSEGQKGE